MSAVKAFDAYAYRIEVVAPAIRALALEGRLARVEGLDHIVRLRTVDGETMILMADASAAAVDTAVAVLVEAGIDPADLRLMPRETLATRPSDAIENLLWLDVLGRASAVRYLTLMAVAGLVAAFGVIDENAILLVGAMALSPDLATIGAACIGIATKHGSLAFRALATLVTGLGLVAFAGWAMTLVLSRGGWLSADYKLGSGGIGLLASFDISTVLIAVACGVAAMLALETRARAAVGIAISVATLPAAAYLGVAAGVGEGSRSAAALGVLLANVVLLVVSGSITVAVQRRVSGSIRTGPSRWGVT